MSAGRALQRGETGLGGGHVHAPRAMQRGMGTIWSAIACGMDRTGAHTRALYNLDASAPGVAPAEAGTSLSPAPVQHPSVGGRFGGSMPINSPGAGAVAELVRTNPTQNPDVFTWRTPSEHADSPGWQVHSGDVPYEALQMGFGAVRRVGRVQWYRGMGGVFYWRGVGDDSGVVDAGGDLGGVSGDTSGSGSGADSVSGSGSGAVTDGSGDASDAGQGVTDPGSSSGTNATPGGSQAPDQSPTQTGATPGGAPSTTTTSTSTTTAPATGTNLAIPILVGAGVVAAGVIGWAAFAKPKAKHIHHAAREEHKASREHARRATRLYRKAAEYRAMEARER